MKDRLVQIPVLATTRQAEASDPQRSVWVRANAGSGKTHVLAQRVVRLLLEGVEPSKILCLTYTKAAAANMQSRVFEWLGEWAVMDDEALGHRLVEFGIRDKSLDRLRHARRLFARALEAPGGLKIQTIHAFCETVLRRFPLEANIAGHFETMDETLQASLMLEARRHILSQTYDEPDAEFRQAFDDIMALAGEAGLESLLSAIIAKREAIQAFIDKVAADERGPDSYQKLFAAYGFSEHDTRESIAKTAWPVPSFDKSYMASLYHAALETQGAAKAPYVLATLLPNFDHASKTHQPLERLEYLCSAIFKADGLEPRAEKGRFNAALRKLMPDLNDRYDFAVAHLHPIACNLQNFAVLEATRSALILASRLLRHYERLKRARGVLDFDDVISRTARLLHRRDVGPWIQYKLDQGIDHVLIDEAQDTSPNQWSVIVDLVNDFFSGDPERNQAKTLFVVGDEKQSIYSFQGARPEIFDEMRRKFTIDAANINQPLRDTSLSFSFRSTADILQGVDAVFAGHEAAKGLSPIGSSPDTHASLRNQQSGAIDLWPREIAEKQDDEEDWRIPVDHASAPAIKVAARIANTIAEWLKQGVRLDRHNRPIKPGDILVLVRKRDRFIHALARDLKRLDVAVAGTDRLKLTTHIGIQDLLALARFCVQPKDDLSLATVLKSPIFGWDETALFALAYGRQTTLFAALKTSELPHHQAITAQLVQWQAMARRLRPHDFFGQILSRDHIRAKLIARLGPEIEDILDEFLAYAMGQENIGLPGLDAFIEALTLSPPDIKREMDQGRDEVRIMTTHASKGLEAPIVFLVDGGGAPYNSQHEPKLLPILPKGAPWHGPGYVWKGDKSAKDAPLFTTPKEELKAAAEDEYRRLLYVAMTRAEDRLIMCGYATKEPGEKAEPTWYDYVEKGLTHCAEGHFEVIDDEIGQEIRRFQISPIQLFGKGKEGAAATASQAQRPLVISKAKRDPSLPKPLAPSGATAMIELGQEAKIMTRSPVLGDWLAQGDESQAYDNPSDALARGSALHRLMQSLPEVPPDERPKRADQYLNQALSHWPIERRNDLRDEALRVFEHPALQAIFVGQSKAEIPLMGTLTLGGAPRAISGQIDRLVITDDMITIVDFKTDRQIPRNQTEIAEAYITQLALYRALIGKIYPQHSIKALLIYTFGPQIIDLTADHMDSALAKLDSDITLSTA